MPTAKSCLDVCKEMTIDMAMNLTSVLARAKVFELKKHSHASIWQGGSQLEGMPGNDQALALKKVCSLRLPSWMA